VNDKNDETGVGNALSTAADGSLPPAPELPFTPPAGALDIEYSDRPAAPPAAQLRGLRVRCPGCGGSLPLAFDVTLEAWQALTDLVAEATGVSRRELGEVGNAGGKRPAARVHSARALRVQLLVKLAEPARAASWLRFIGWSSRRIDAMAQAQLEPDHAGVLEGMNLSMMIGAPVAEDG